MAQAGMPCMQLLLLVCCVCILLRLHLHATEYNVPHPIKPTFITHIGPAKLLEANALSIQLIIPLLNEELGTVTAWRELYCAICTA